MKPFAVALSLLLAACGSTVPWQNPAAGAATTWRHCRVFQGPAATILAPDEGDAAALHDLATRLASDLQTALGHPGPRGLWLAVTPEAPLPVGDHDPDAYWRTVQRWHQSQLGNRLEEPRTAPTKDGTPVPPLERGVLVRLFASPAPLDAPELDLPPELRQGIDYIALVPTAAGIEAGAEALFDAAMAVAPVSTMQLALLSAMGKHPTTLLAAQLASARNLILVETALASLHLAPGPTNALREKLGLPKRADPDDPAAPLPAALAERATQALQQDYRTPPPADDPRLALNCSVGPIPDRELQPVFAQSTWQVVVELGPAPVTDFAQRLAAHGRHHVRIDDGQWLPTRASIDRLAAVLREHPYATVLVCSIDAERAALLVAGYAFHHRGVTVAEALALARHYGASRQLATFESTLVRPLPR